MPYNTFRNADVGYDTHTWYDELIISRNKIADPGATPMPTDALPPAKPQGLVLR